MLLAILIPVAILGVLVLAAVLFFQRGGAGIDASPRSLLRIYLYLGSLVSILVLVWGLSVAGTGVIGAIAPDFAYGSPALVRPVPDCPPGEARCGPNAPEQAALQRQQWERQTRENLLQGLTSAIAGALFWAVHWYGRREIETRDERAGLLRRGFYLVGTAVFGIASIVLLPAAVYSALRFWLIPLGEFDFRPGVGESLAAALVVVPAWLVFLRIVLGEMRRQPPPVSAEVP